MKPLYDLSEKRALTRRMIFLTLVDLMDEAARTGVIKTIKLSDIDEPDSFSPTLRFRP